MRSNYFDRFDELQDDEILDDENTDSESEENYPTAEEYNRIYKQRYDYY